MTTGFCSGGRKSSEPRPRVDFLATASSADALNCCLHTDPKIQRATLPSSAVIRDTMGLNTATETDLESGGCIRAAPAAYGAIRCDSELVQAFQYAMHEAATPHERSRRRNCRKNLFDWLTWGIFHWLSG